MAMAHSDMRDRTPAVLSGPAFVLGAPSRSGLRPAIFVDARRRPRYTREKRLKDGSIAYYWAIPTWAKRQGCPMPPCALGRDRHAAFVAAERLNVAFERWRKSRNRGKPATIPTRPGIRSDQRQKLRWQPLEALSSFTPACDV